MNRLESPKLGKFLFFFFEAPRENGKFPGKYQKWRHLARVQNCSSSFSYSGEMSTALYRALRERSLGHVRTLQRGVGKKESCKSSFEVRALAQSSVGASLRPGVYEAMHTACVYMPVSLCNRARVRARENLCMCA